MYIYYFEINCECTITFNSPSWWLVKGLLAKLYIWMRSYCKMTIIYHLFISHFYVVTGPRAWWVIPNKNVLKIKYNKECIIRNIILTPRHIFTYLSRDKAADIFQMTFSIVFSRMKSVAFWLIFHWNVFPRGLLKICQHWFIWWFDAEQIPSHYVNQWCLVYWLIYATFGLDEFKDFITNNLWLRLTYLETDRHTFCIHWQYIP